MSFVHLHVHSEYSTLDGAARIPDLVKRSVELGHTALALTEHGTMSGVYELIRECNKAGIKPIVGCEFYIQAPDGGNNHLVVLAKNNKGMENMLLLLEFSNFSNFYKRPRITYEKLYELKEGLIITSACLAGTIPRHIMHGEIINAMSLARELKEQFGEDFYLEIQPNLIPEQLTVNKSLISIGNSLGIELVVANDVHYTRKEDAFSHEVLLAMQMKKKMNDEKRYSFSTEDFYMKDEDEMREQLSYMDKYSLDKAIANTCVIADKCNVILSPTNRMPKYYNIPNGKTSRSLLAERIMEGMKKLKYEAHAKDLQYELDVIDRNGYSDYFLIVQDYIASAKARGELVSPGRGSGCGSKVIHVTGVSEVDPVKYNLLFERFLVDGRVPDIDLDVSDQAAVFKDLQKKYGVRNVAHIVTFGRMTPKAVLRKVLSVFSWEQYRINAISKLLSDGAASIEEEMSKSAELREILSSTIDGYAPHTYLEVIKVLENVISHEGKHAGGVVIYENLPNNAPVKRDQENHNNYTIAMDKYEVETNGFTKLDILSIETISVIDWALRSIKGLHNVTVDWNTIDRDDEEVYNMLSKGNVSGVFQLANQGDKVARQQPCNFLDLIAINALIRPGTEFEEYLLRKAGKEWSVHTDRMYYMEETFGLHVYQEQYLLDAKVLAGWDLAFADKNIRKNKNIDKDEVIHELFIRNAVERGYEVEMLEEVWQSILKAATNYGFCKGHATAYAVVAFQTAWLKCYYPIEFYSALMTKFGADTNEVANLISEAKRLGIKILPPNINTGTDKFVPTKEGIQYRITTINTIGDKALEDIYKKRPFTSLDDLMLRRDTQLLNNTNIRNLIKCGAMDWTGNRRNYMLWEVDMLLRKKTEIKNNVILPMHPDGYDHIYEFDSLGIYLTKHPMEGKGSDFERVEDESNCTVYGIIFEVAVVKQKNGKEMAFVTLNTATGNVKVLVFAHMYGRTKDFLQKGIYIWVKGKKSKSALLLDSVGEAK